MRWIEKSKLEPADLLEYKAECRRQKQQPAYRDMPKEGVRRQLAEDQGYLCAYCMRRLTLVHTQRAPDREDKELDPCYLNIEHLAPQNQISGEEATLFANMIGVCPGRRSEEHNHKKTCDAFRGSLPTEQQAMRLNPLDQDQMESIFYMGNGEIHSTDPILDAELSDKLNLNGNDVYLKANRKGAYRKLIEALKRERPIEDWTKSFLMQAWKQFCTRDKEGRYREYVGVYEYWLKKWMKKYP